MSQAPIMPVATDALLADTLHLSAEEFGAYHLILYATWRNNGIPLPDDNARLARITRMTPARWSKVRPALTGFFDISDGSWRQKRLEKEWARVQQNIERSRENGKKGGRPKSLQDNNSENPLGSSRDTQTESKSEPGEKLSNSISNSNSKVEDTAPPRAGAREGDDVDLVGARPDVLKPRPLAIVEPPALAETPKTAFDALTAKEEAALVVSVGHRILEACEVDPAKWAGNYSLVSMWLRSGFDVDLDILPTCRRLAKSLGRFPATLAYFTNAIDESHRARNATIQPSTRRNGNGSNSGRQRVADAAERADARRQDIASVLGILPEEIWPTHGAITIEGVVND